MDFETAQRKYAEMSLTQRGKPCPWGRNWDFHSLLDAIFSDNSMCKVVAEKNYPLGRMAKNSLFMRAVISSRHIEEGIKLEERRGYFWDCWVSFRKIVETRYSEGEKWSDELIVSSGRLLFLAAVIFNLPDNCSLENIISNPNARHIVGSYWAEAEDIEFCKTLPCDLTQNFKTQSDVLICLKTNLDFFQRKIESTVPVVAN